MFAKQKNVAKVTGAVDWRRAVSALLKTSAETGVGLMAYVPSKE